MTRRPSRPLPVPVLPGARMLRASWRHLLIVVAVALQGSPGGAQVASADAATDLGTLAVSGNPVAEVPLDRLSDTRNRPLFSPSRRPLAPPVQPDHPAVARVEHAPQALLSLPSVALFGIVVGAQGPRAFIATESAGRIIGVRPGDDVLGWTVTAITERRLVLSHADRSATFTLFSVANAGQIERSDATASSRPAIRTADPPRGRVRVR
jgi:hypothetical protein